MAVAHCYLEALAWQRDVAQLHAIFGGKNPHPNFLVGGTPSPISRRRSLLRLGLDLGQRAWSLNMSARSFRR